MSSAVDAQRLERLRAVADAAARARPDVRLVALFGSTARRSDRIDSDVDVAIAGGGFWEALEIGEQVAAVLGRDPDVVELATASDLLRYHVARDGVPLFEAAPGAWAAFQADSALRYFDLAPLLQESLEGARRRLEREGAHHG